MHVSLRSMNSHTLLWPAPTEVLLDRHASCVFVSASALPFLMTCTVLHRGYRLLCGWVLPTSLRVPRWSVRVKRPFSLTLVLPLLHLPGPTQAKSSWQILLLSRPTASPWSLLIAVRLKALYYDSQTPPIFKSILA